MAIAEFYNDQQRADHLAALEHEKEGYEALLERVDLDEVGPSKKRIERTIEEIGAEIDRINGLESVEETVEEEKPKRSRSKAKAAGKDDDSDGADADGKEQ